MATGPTLPTTAWSGGRPPWCRAGRRTATEVGLGSLLGAGHGWRMSPGDLPPSTTDVGLLPRPSMVRPVYAPALVSWAGGGPGFHFSAGVGVAWFPLAPGEVFIPGYHVSRAYVNSVNVTNTAVNVTRVTNVYNAMVVNRGFSNVTYANRNVRGGVTVVSHDTFVNGRSVARNVMPIPQRELVAAPVSNALAVEPARSSVFGAGRPVANKPPVAAMSRPVVALRMPAPLPRTIGAGTTGASAGSASAGQNSIGQGSVRQQPPGRPVPMTRPTQSRAQAS